MLSWSSIPTGSKVCDIGLFLSRTTSAISLCQACLKRKSTYLPIDNNGSVIHGHVRCMRYDRKRYSNARKFTVRVKFIQTGKYRNLWFYGDFSRQKRTHHEFSCQMKQSGRCNGLTVTPLTTALDGHQLADVCRQ